MVPREDQIVLASCPLVALPKVPRESLDVVDSLGTRVLYEVTGDGDNPYPDLVRPAAGVQPRRGYPEAIPAGRASSGLNRPCNPRGPSLLSQNEEGPGGAPQSAYDSLLPVGRGCDLWGKDSKGANQVAPHDMAPTPAAEWPPYRAYLSKLS